MKKNKMNSKKTEYVLPMEYPIVTSYALYSNILSILLNYNECLPWVMERFIQLKWYKDPRQSPLVFYDVIFERDPSSICPWIQYDRISKELVLEKWDMNISDFLVDALNHEYYILLRVDKYYIPGTIAYKKRQFMHPLFIFGYNLDQKKFNIAGTLTNYKYMYSTCTFEQMRQSCLNGSKDEGLVGGIVLYKFNKTADHEFNIERVIELIKNYLFSTNMYYKQEPDFPKSKRDDYIFGISIYQNLIEKLNLLLVGKNQYFSIKPFHVLWDHKKCMLLRIKYLGENNYLQNHKYFYNQYEKIEKNALIQRNMMLKYQLNQNSEIIKNVINKIEKNVIEEKNLLMALLDNI